jgi:hypothetical protein
MRRALALVTILGAAWAVSAAADGGGPSPGLDFGNGILDTSGTHRYVALSDGRTTLLESIEVRSGRVQRIRYLEGAYGIPMVTYSGQTGGFSRDGSRLVLASWPGAKSVTRFVAVDPVDFHALSRVRLHGRFAFDALSPNGTLMYLLQYLGKPNAVNQPYAVRAFNWRRGKLLPGAIVDKREPDEKMNGMPMTRTGSTTGWAYTLYQRQGKKPFVHALDTVHRRAFCVDLPWRNSDSWIQLVKMRVRGGMLVLRRDGHAIAQMDRKTLKVTS